jgi:hypothetical protein
MHQKQLVGRTVSAVTLLLISCLIASCGGSDNHDSDRPKISIMYDGLNGRIITRLYEFEGKLFAATDSGLYTKTKGDNPWQSTGLNNREILDLVILDDDHYIASIYRYADEPPIYQLVETTNSGTSWHQIVHDFGGEEGEEAIFGLHYDNDNNAIYATGIEVLAVSLDEGRHWDIINGYWQGFGQPKTIVKRNATKNEVWYGGQNALEQLVLRAWSLDTSEERLFTDLLPNPSVIYGIQFDPTNSSRIIVSGEGGVLQSMNNGVEWTTLIGDVDYRFYFNVALDPDDPQILYTAGWDKNYDSPQPLIFEISVNGGGSWTQYHYPSNSLFGGVRSLIAVEEENKTVVYLGLYRGGIMKVKLPQ